MKITKICTMLTACFLLAGCNNADNKNDNKNNDKEINENNNKNDGNNNNNNKEAEEQKITLEPNTPQSWIDMFTFDNVTISVDYNLSILTDYTYKCVGGKWYCKAERPEESFIEHNGRDIFDTYLTHYSFLHTMKNILITKQAIGLMVMNQDMFTQFILMLTRTRKLSA